MTVTPRALIEGQDLTNAFATYYTSTGVRSRIDKLTFTNHDAAARTINVSIVPSGGAQANANLTTDAKVLQPGETWNSPNEVGQVLEPGDFISMKADANTVVSVRASGVQVS